MRTNPDEHIPAINAEFSMDHQHGPIVTVTVDSRRISIYLMHETGTVTRDDGVQYGIEVKGPWYEFRHLFGTPMRGG